MKNFCYALLCLTPFVALGDNDISKVNTSIRVEAGQVAGDVGTVNGSIHVEDGATTEDVETVNGSINIGDRARVAKVDTVNGGIRIGEATHATSVETVNGTLKLGPGANVAEGVSAVNGSIVLGKAAEVGGRLETVNGKMTLEAAHVAGGLETTNGDIEVGAGSRVEGGILVEKPRGNNWFGGKRRPPTVVIGPDAVVEGELKFEQPVHLYVSDRARIGPVSGASAVRFSGERPTSADKEAAEEKVER